MLSFAYRTLTDIGAPVIRAYLRRRLKAGREDAARFHERLGEASRERPEGFLIWSHAASVGEAVSILSLIDKVRENYPAARILITTGTVTSARLLEGRLPPDVIHQYIPVDVMPYVRRFLDHWHPDLVLWVESELWPNFLSVVRERKIPAVLLNGRMSDKSFRQWYRARKWTKEILGTFSLCLTQTEAERGRFVTLGAKPVHCVGNLKYAANPLPHSVEELNALKSTTAERKIWLMASTHQGEEEIAAEVHKQLKNKIPSLLTIIVPRHAVRGDEVMAQIASLGLKSARRSKGDAITADTDIYLGDTMGELGLFYRLAPIVAMGGSFIQNGGHNPVEVAQLGGALIFGPSMFNFSEITREFVFRHAAIQLRHANDLPVTIARLITNPYERDTMARNARVLADEKRHVLDDVLNELRPFLRNSKLQPKPLETAV